MSILRPSLITTLIAGLLLSAVSADMAFGQRGGGGGNRSGGGGGNARSGGAGGQRGGGGGQTRQGPSRGSRSQFDRAPSGGQSRSNSNRTFNDGQRNPGQFNRRDGQRPSDAQRDGDRGSRSFTDRNFQRQGSRTNNYRGENFAHDNRDSNRNNVNPRNDNRNRSDFDRGRYTDSNRGNLSRGNSNSQFFGPRGAFGNSYLGRGGYGTFGNYGRGYGYGGWNGYGGYGLGYGRYGGYGFLPFLGGLGLGYGLGGYGLGYGGYGLGYGGFGPAYGGYYGPNYVQTVPQTVTADSQPATPVDSSPATGADFVAQGEQAFRAGNYQAAMMSFRHALVDEPNNAGLMLLIGQCLFQTGQWSEAAGATELAMGALPEDKWGTVVQNYTQLYGNIEDYTRRLKDLEDAVKQDPNNPALRFLIGYHFGYLNYPQQAVRELGKSVELEGRDPAARRLHDIFAAKIGAATVGPVPQSASPAAAPSSTIPQSPPAARLGTDG